MAASILFERPLPCSPTLRVCPVVCVAKIYSFNEANTPDWPENLQNYVMDLKNVSLEAPAYTSLVCII